MNIEEQLELLMQGTEYGDEELKKAMTNELRQRLMDAQKEDRPLRVYCGYDPTSKDLHLGHTITMRKLRQFQDLGHEVTFLIGSYTALVGDPSDKNKARPILTEEQVAENSRTYTEQAFRVLDREKTKVRYNGEWLSELSLVDLIRLGQNFTVQQFLARENFANRLEKGEAIYLKETTIGVAVFGRSPDYDPKVDTIVRSQAWRLRSKLKKYYSAEGIEDPVVIDLPLGHYVPVFSLRHEPEREEPH